MPNPPRKVGSGKRTREFLEDVFNDPKYKTLIAVIDNNQVAIGAGVTVNLQYPFNEGTVITRMNGSAYDNAGLSGCGMFNIDLRFANNKVITSSPINGAALFGTFGEREFTFPKPLIFQTGDRILVTIVSVTAAIINRITIGFIGAYDATQGAG
jgi:hypothetical protein